MICSSFPSEILHRIFLSSRAIAAHIGGVTEMTDTIGVTLDADLNRNSASASPQPRRRNREDWPPRLRRREASAYLAEVHGFQEAPTTLAKRACLGGGPVFELFGRTPYYRTESLDLWAAERLSRPRRSTSDPTGSASRSGEIDDRATPGALLARPSQVRTEKRKGADPEICTPSGSFPASHESG